LRKDSLPGIIPKLRIIPLEIICQIPKLAISFLENSLPSKRAARGL